MTPQSDRDRIAAIRRFDLVVDNFAVQKIEPTDVGEWVRYNDVRDRLAALERERDYWKDTVRAWIAANAPSGWIDDLRKAESALLNLQTAVRELLANWQRQFETFNRDADPNLSSLGNEARSTVGALATVTQARIQELAALLPDPAPTFESRTRDTEALLQTAYGSPKVWACRVHPTDWWHEVGCPHRSWTEDDLRRAGYGHLIDQGRAEVTRG